MAAHTIPVGKVKCGGDYEAIEYVLNQKGLDTLAVAVNPRGTWDLVTVYVPQGQIIKVLVSPART